VTDIVRLLTDTCLFVLLIVPTLLIRKWRHLLACVINAVNYVYLILNDNDDVPCHCYCWCCCCYLLFALPLFDGDSYSLFLPHSQHWLWYWHLNTDIYKHSIHYLLFIYYSLFILFISKYFWPALCNGFVAYWTSGYRWLVGTFRPRDDPEFVQVTTHVVGDERCWPCRNVTTVPGVDHDRRCCCSPEQTVTLCHGQPSSSSSFLLPSS